MLFTRLTITTAELQAHKDDPRQDHAANMAAQITARIDADLRSMLRRNTIVPWRHSDGSECHCHGPCKGKA